MTNIPVKFRVDRINEAVEALKEDFYAYITDKSYPLEERWEVFCKANDALSNDNPYLPNIQCLEDIGYDWYDDCFPDGRGSSRVKDFVESLEDNLDYIEESKKDKEYYNRYWKKYEDLDINQVKEEFLALNIKQIVFDW
jgi:hypothetical protein